MRQAPAPISAILDWPGTALLVRVGLALPFAVSGVVKLLDWPGAVAEAAALGFAAPALVAAATIATQLVGSALLLSVRWCWLGAGILAVFTAAATVIAHAFWAADGAERAHQLATFLEHVAIVAGLAAAAILANGARRP
ncbi:DoxX family protein [Acuticoccus sediminis]|uniref:DoxX family protein n=1 Tax=Acuticoccus sediminis TaxID=2184697 RepID=A0A8B2NXN0_9HYPH|nr:DoxX family protein [Acuticoccus sediminis]RAI02553.1 DoxX family protein [Acuticoccus sediminis]